MFKDQFDPKRNREVTEQAQEALNRIRNRKKQGDFKAKIEESKNKIDYTSRLIEEFNDEAFENKVYLDRSVYNQFFTKIDDEEVAEQIQERVAHLLENVKEIYKHINMEPKVYGFKNMNKDTNQEKLEEEGNRVVNKYLERNYYSMPKEKRTSEYFEGVQHLARDFIVEEAMNTDDAVQHAFKTTLLEGLIHAVNFPSIAENRAKELMGSEEYGEFFNQEELIQCWENFQEEAHNLARVFAVLS